MILQRIVYAAPFFQPEDPVEVEDGVVEIQYSDGQTEKFFVKDLEAITIHDRQPALRVVRR